MNIKNIPKNTKILIGGIALVVIVFFVVRATLKSEPVLQEPINEISVEEKTPVKVSPSKTPVVDSAPVEKLLYGEAVVKYKDSRIQFVGETCQAVPSNQSFKVGTSLMLDNRSSKPATISIGPILYLVEPFGYHIVELKEVGSFTANCNEQKNVLTLTIQK